MTDVREATDDLLAERPELESELRELLAVDDRADGWTFDEVPLDSGVFGELVSRNIVAKDGDEYEVADPGAVRASLDGEEATESDDSDGAATPSVSLSADSVPSALRSFSSLRSLSLSRTDPGALGGALAFLVLMRTYILPNIFRGEYVVLSSNDPYLYRYWVERLAAEATGVLDLSVLSGLPGSVSKGEPLMVATLWWFSNLFGGADAAGWVLAWYPVVSALVVGVLTYAIAVRLTDDRRVGVASVVLLAVIPAFAYRTGLGFADHHAFDYPWLALTALALVWLADVDRESLSTLRPWLGAGLLGVAVAGQVMAWEAGPLLVGAVGIYVAVQAVADVRADRSPLVGTAPILAGLALASVLSHLMHTGFGWHTDIVAYAPALLFVGVAGVTALGEAVRRAGMPAFVLGTAEVAGALGGLALVFTLLPSYATTLGSRLDFLLFKSGPAETQSMFAGGGAGFFLGPILELGFAWVLGLPMLAVASLRAYRRNCPAWLVVCTYGWYFLVLSSLQRRFVGELAPFFAVLAGYAFVLLAAKLDLTTPPAFERASRGQGASAKGPRSRKPTAGDGGRPGPRSLSVPNRGTITAVAILLLFVTSAGAGQTAIRHEQVEIVDEKFEAAVWMDEYAAEQGWEYRENYVLSKWGRNRMYNYFVNGESRSYGFAENNYEAFLSSPNPEAQYQKLRDEVGFVVTKTLDQEQIPPATNYARLHQRFGSAGPNGASGSGHYRAVYASENGFVKVFTLVPGATITGKAGPNETLTAKTEVTVSGHSFTYERTVSANKFGVYELTVAYPGTYRLGNRTIDVSEETVSSGQTVNFLGDSGAYWPFDTPADDTAYDIRSGNHANADSGTWVDGHNGSALELNQSDSLHVGRSPSLDANGSITVSTWFRTNESVDYRNDVKSPQLAIDGEKIAYRNTDGYRLAMSRGRLLGAVGDGPGAGVVRGPRVDDGKWHHAVVTWNGSTVTLYLDGSRVGRTQWSGSLDNEEGLTIGQDFPGTIDDLRIYERGLSQDEVQALYSEQAPANETDG